MVWQLTIVGWLLGTSGLPTPFGLSVDADMKDTAHHALYAEASDLISPDKTYYEMTIPMLTIYWPSYGYDGSALAKIELPVDATKTVKLALALIGHWHLMKKKKKQRITRNSIIHEFGDFIQQQTTLDFTFI